MSREEGNPTYLITRCEDHVFDLEDGRQALISLMPTGDVTLAFRSHRSATWQPPFYPSEG